MMNDDDDDAFFQGRWSKIPFSRERRRKKRSEGGGRNGEGTFSSPLFLLFHRDREIEREGERERGWTNWGKEDGTEMCGSLETFFWMERELRADIGFQEKEENLNLERKVWSRGGSTLFLRRSRAVLQFGFLQLFGYVRCSILLLRCFCLSGYGTGDRLVCNGRLLGRVVSPVYTGWGAGRRELRFFSLRF